MEQKKYPPLRCVKVTFSDGDTITTEMNSELSDDEIRSYYRIGRVFNLGCVNDRLVKVTNVEILR